MFAFVLALAGSISALAPDALHDQRFYAEPFASRARQGEADPYDYPTSSPTWIQFVRPGVVTMQFGHEQETHRLRAHRRGDRWIITLFASDGREISRRFSWRWLDDGRAETDLLDEGGPGSVSV